MLSTMRNSWLLFALLAIFGLASALNAREAVDKVDGIVAYLHHGEKRQASGTGNSPSPSPTDNDNDNEPSNSPTPTSTSNDDQSTSSTPPPSSTPTTTRPTRTSTSSTPSQTSPSSTPEPSSTPPPESDPVQDFTTFFTTVTNGQTSVGTSTGRTTLAPSTTQSSNPNSPLPQGGNDGNGGGLSDKNKTIIGGVVGGVGGAILLGGIAIVCWRIWGKKRRVSEDDDDIMAGTGSALGDKPHSASTTGSPFQSNLEQYHNPGGRPNAASNF